MRTSIAALFAACLLSFGCSKEKPDGEVACASNLDCTAPGTRCETSSGRCVCATDEACLEGFFCNNVGVCQAVAGCLNNADCERMPNSYCDLASGQCLAGPALMLSSPCGAASHCPFATTCVDGTCVPNCFDDGDCPLGQICYQDQCVTGNNICSNDDFCGYGELCKGGLPGTCTDDFRGPYCRGCSQRQVPQNPEPCDHPRNFCLINSLESNGFRNFCGVDCSLGQECPNGYNCNNVVILTDDICYTNAQCRCEGTITNAVATCTVAAACDPRLPDGSPDPNAALCRIPGEAGCNGGTAGGPAACYVPRGQRNGTCECATTADCAGGTVCVDGFCCGGDVRDDRQCAGGENRVSGFCTCATDEDCPRDVCDGSRRACAISGMPCEPGQNDCGAIPCVNGGCLIGANCAPLAGLSCTIVTQDD
jgi:hypothetical protein